MDLLQQLIQAIVHEGLEVLATTLVLCLVVAFLDLLGGAAPVGVQCVEGVASIQILQSLVEDELSIQEICAGGHDIEIVTRIHRLLYIAEYKRRQGPPGVKITRRAFGRDRRYPITNGFLRAE